MHHIGELIKQKRLELGMTQEELAHKVGYKSRVSINKIELQRDIPIKRLMPIADVLGIDIHVLVGFPEKPTGKYSHIDTAAIADLMLDPLNKDLIDIINKMDPSQKEELYDYATFLLNKKRG